MALQMLAAAPSASAVVDEPAHLTSGVLALAQGDLTVNREHPPLAKILAALPVMLLHPVLPPVRAEDPPRASEDFEFSYSRRFLYETNDADRLLAAARKPIMALSLAAGLLVWLWGRRLLGATAALAGLALTVFEPNLLAHGRLVTTDMAATLFTLGAFAALERTLAGSAAGRPTRLWTIASGTALGLGLLSRFSCVLAVPLLGLAAAVDARGALRSRGITFVVVVLIALAVVNGFYLAAGQGSVRMLFPLAQEPVTGPLRTAPLAGLEASPLMRWLPLPLPRLYLEGLDLARYKNLYQEGPSYLNGRYSEDGFWSYFLQALAMKTTLPMLLLAVLGLLAMGLRAPPRRELLVWVLLPLAGTIAITTALSRAQIGLRYVLPAIPFLCLAGGAGAAAAIDRSPAGTPWRRAAGTIVALLLAWHAGEALSIHPYHLAYFNEAAGGPDRGYRHLVDSNLDWGQDLVGLARFMRQRGLDRINLYYFGTADPAYYGITRNVPPQPGWFAISATHLMGVYLPDRDYLAPFRTMPTQATIGHSILLYRLDEVPPFLRNPIKRR